MESSVSSPSPSMEVWHFQIAVYFAFGFFFLRLFLDRFVFQVSKRISSFWFQRKLLLPLLAERLVLNSPLIYLIMYMRWHLKFFNKYEILIVVHLYQRIAVWLLSTGSSPMKLNDATTRAKIVKCKESLWKLLYYAGCDFFVLQVVYHEPWVRDIKLYFDGWPNQELKWVIKSTFTFASCLEFLGLELCSVAVEFVSWNSSLDMWFIIIMEKRIS